MSSFVIARGRSRLVVSIAVATVLSISLQARIVSAQGISYTLAPAAASLSWDKDLGLKNHSLYGGQGSIDFERLISLQGYYLTNNNINSAVDRLGLGGDLGSQLRNQRLQVRSMGANVIWKFWGGGIAPFIKTGGGVIELRPDSGRTSKQIVLNAGGGLRFGANAPLFLDLFAEDMMLRVDRYALFSNGTGTLPVDAQANHLRHNLLIGAAIGVPLGLNTNDREREKASDLRWGLTGASLTLEPFAGRMQFDDKGSNGTIADQNLAGARAGIDVGRYVGVRGFYWRSTNSSFKRLTSLQSWGGELQFKLNSGQGLTPYLLAGAAQLDFRENDSTALVLRGTDKASLLLGGGVMMPLGERFALNASARDYVYGQGNGADSVSSPSDLRHNWMYSVGLRVSLGGHSGSDAARRAVDREKSLAARVRDDSSRLDAMHAQMQGKMQANMQPNMQAAMQNGTGMHGERKYSVDSTGRVTRLDSASELTDSAHVVTTNRAGSLITLPAPTVGELYVRYGDSSGSMFKTPITAADSDARRSRMMAAGVNSDELRAMVRSVVREELASGTATSDSARWANMSAVDRETYVNRRIDSIVAVRVAARAASTPAPVIVAPPTTIVPPTQITTQPPSASPVVVEQSTNRYSIYGNDRRGGLMVYSGVTVSSSAQISLGGRFDLGPISPNSSIDFAPEIAIGGGSGGRSTMIVANLQYLFGKIRGGTNWTIQPHVVAGIGILNFSSQVGSRDGLEGVINFGYGVSVPLTRNTNRAAPVITVEHQGIDFFQLNRLLVGLSWRL
ncbi:MAG: hypothetical protein ABJB66_16480 [Gemmatimonadaceae bacterium]